MSTSNNRILNTFALTMMAIVAIIDLRGLPMMASYGLSSIFFYGIAALFFLIPSGLICAELATHQTEAGGLYLWIRNSFGDQIGFLAIWLEWLNNVVSYPASLSFIAVIIAYLFDKNMAQHKSFIFIITMIALWGTTWITALGLKASSFLSTVGALLGTIIPGIIIAVLGLFWLLAGKPLQMNIHLTQIIPDFHHVNLAFFAGTLLGYAGMQVIAFHSTNVKNPQRNYPRAIWLSMLIIFLITVAGSLAVAVVVPNNQLNLVSGLMDSFNLFFTALHLQWATPILMVLILLSIFATLSTWFLGPARGLAIAAQNGFFPKIFAYTNKQQAPVNILIMQAVVASIFSMAFLYMPSISSGFWLLLNLSSESTMVMYILIFAAAVRRRYSSQNQFHGSQAYKIPGGNWVMWLIAGMGISACMVALVASVIPPTLIKMGITWHYELILFTCNIVFLSIPFAISYACRRSNTTSKFNVEISS